jgi:hypothetical protein
MKSKFKNLSFDSIEVLSKEEKKKITGGVAGAYGGGPGGVLSCVVSSTCTSWMGSNYWVSAYGSTCSEAYSKINCGARVTEPGPCYCSK